MIIKYRLLLTLTCVTICLSVVMCSEKKGVVHWAPSFMCDDFKVLDNMSWWYDFRMSLYYFHENDICSSTIDNYKSTHVPMVWGYWSNTVIQIADEAKAILGFNEPNHKAQAKMTAQYAADAWPEMERNSKGKPLVSPSAAPCGADCISSDIEWFNEFFELCKDCRVDYLAAHTYWCNANQVMRYLSDLHDRYGRKIWLSEFACSGDVDAEEQLRFMQEILPMLEEADYIYRYSWYAARLTDSGFVTASASLLEPESSTLTPLGEFYNNFQGNVIPEEEEEEEQDVETLLILQAFTSNPTPWWKMINYVTSRTYLLPQPIRELYESMSKTDIKKRIKQKFLAIMCADLDSIEDQEIREMVEEKSHLQENGPRKKNSGRLRVPGCSRRSLRDM